MKQGTFGSKLEGGSYALCVLKNREASEAVETAVAEKTDLSTGSIDGGAVQVLYALIAEDIRQALGEDAL